MDNMTITDSYLIANYEITQHVSTAKTGYKHAIGMYNKVAIVDVNFKVLFTEFECVGRVNIIQSSVDETQLYIYTKDCNLYVLLLPMAAHFSSHIPNSENSRCFLKMFSDNDQQNSDNLTHLLTANMKFQTISMNNSESKDV